MPRTTQSFLRWLREHEPPQFDQLRYSDEDREHIAGSLKSAARLDPHGDPPLRDIYPLLNQIEDIAAAYVALDQAIKLASGWPSRSDQRKQLARLAGANNPKVFRKAAVALHPSLWFSMALDDVVLDWKHWRDLLTATEFDPEILLPHASAIKAAAQQAWAALEGQKSKPDPRKYALHVWFARQLISIYEETTGERATAYHTEHEPGPFVRFIMACLEPIDHEVKESALNEAIYNHLFKARP